MTTASALVTFHNLMTTIRPVAVCPRATGPAAIAAVCRLHLYNLRATLARASFGAHRLQLWSIVGRGFVPAAGLLPGVPGTSQSPGAAPTPTTPGARP